MRPTYQAFINAKTNPIKAEIPDKDSRGPMPGPMRYNPWYTINSSGQQQRSEDCTNSFFAVLKQTITLGFDTELVHLLQCGLPELPSSESKLWSHRNFLMKFCALLVDVLQSVESEAIFAVVRTFIISTACGLAKYLWQHRPMAPRNWTRTTNHTCDAPSCREVRRFLADPNQASARFSYPQRERKHMENSLRWEDYKFETIKTKSPHTLVIHKTTNEYARAKDRWEGDIRNMHSAVHLWCSDASFQHVLGAELEPLFAKVTQLLRGEDGLDRTQLQAQAMQPFRPTSTSAQNSRAAASGNGQSAKSEIIDLTGGAGD
jgi:hypothetical protein